MLVGAGFILRRRAFMLPGGPAGVLSSPRTEAACAESAAVLLITSY